MSFASPRAQADVGVLVADIFVQPGEQIAGIFVEDFRESFRIVRDPPVMPVGQCREQERNVIGAAEIGVGVRAAFDRQVASQIAAIISVALLGGDAPGVVVRAAGNAVAPGREFQRHQAEFVSDPVGGLLHVEFLLGRRESRDFSRTS